MAWFGLDGTLISPDDAKELMEDVEGRTIARDLIEVRPGLVVEIRTLFVCHAEVDDQGNPRTPLWETVSVVRESTVEGHMTPGAAKQGHALTVRRFRAAAHPAPNGDQSAGEAP